MVADGNPDPICLLSRIQKQAKIGSMFLSKDSTKDIIYRRFGKVLSLFYRGRGSILMLHRVCEPRAEPRLGYDYIEMSPDFLESAIGFLRDENYEFISLDDVPNYLQKPRKRRFVALTFDDGYVDNYEIAQPICQKYSVPFAIYVVNNYLSRRNAPWWYFLEDYLAEAETLNLEFEGRALQFSTRTWKAKKWAFDELAQIFLTCSGERTQRLLEQIGGKGGVRACAEKYTMSWEQARQLHASGSVTIGAHSMDHTVLAAQTYEHVCFQIEESKKHIEAELGAPCKHFAYPYGTLMQLGAREVELVQRCGYATATTSRVGNIFTQHREHLFELPRVYSMRSDLHELQTALSGAVAALRHRGRRLVTT